MCHIVDQYQEELEWVKKPENQRFETAGEAFTAICMELNTKIDIVNLIHLHMYHSGKEYMKYECMIDYPLIAERLQEYRIERLNNVANLNEEEYKQQTISDFNLVMAEFNILYRITEQDL